MPHDKDIYDWEKDWAFEKASNTYKRKTWTKATEENWPGSLEDLYENHGFVYMKPKSDKEMFNMAQLYPDKDEISEDQIIMDSLNDYIQQSNSHKKIPENSKFREAELLREVENYIANTYDEHYSQGDIQIFESIAANGHGEGFACGNIQKLAARYGKKHGYNRDDLLKIIHYGILLLWDHDKNKRK